MEDAVSGSLTAVASGEDMVPASEALKQVRELQRLLGKKTMEMEILKKNRGVWSGPKMDSACTLVAKGQGITQVSNAMSVSCAQLSLRINRSADWQDGHCNRRDEEADDEVLSRILGIINDMPSYGYRRLPVNAKRVYRVMREHNRKRTARTILTK